MTGMARHALTVTFRNQGDKDVDVSVLAVQSVLGNFAPRPERLLLAPTQTAALDNMFSANATSFEAVQLTVTVRSSGQTETVVVSMRATERIPPVPETSPARR